MSRVLVVATSEFLTLVKTKAFIIGILMMPVLVGASIAFQVFAEKRVDREDHRFAVIDRTGVLYESIAKAAEGHNEKSGSGANRTGPYFLPRQVELGGRSLDEARLSLSEQVRHKDLFGFVVIPADADHQRGVDRPHRVLHGVAVVHRAAELARDHADEPDHRAAVRPGEHRSGAREQAEQAGGRGRLRPGRAQPGRLGAAGQAGGRAADVRGAVRADVPAVPGRDGDGAAAAERDHRGEDEPDQRGAGRVGLAVPVDDGQARRRVGRLGAAGARLLRGRGLRGLLRRALGPDRSDADRLVPHVPHLRGADVTGRSSSRSDRPVPTSRTRRA